jgi:hypothetical protein
MVFKLPTELELSKIQITKSFVEDEVRAGRKLIRVPRERTFTAELTYVNNELLYRMAYARINEGLEYPYDLFDLADNPSIIDKITNL